jgi:hypothetical protein
VRRNKTFFTYDKSMNREKRIPASQSNECCWVITSLPWAAKDLRNKNCDMALRRCTKVSEGCEPLRKRGCRVIDDILSNYLKESHPAVDGMVARRRDREVIQIITGTGRGRGPIQTRFFV